jgi:class 3 adenylate cyclase/tetratricopeptide (TPR) repeat protein
MDMRPICPNCGSPNVAGAPICQSCGATLSATPPPATGARKVVTVLFSDVTGSTDLGQRLDPESVRQLLGRYFEEMRSVIERHGGTVEKFIGDAVHAVFGVPRLHEDDALRAVRAAVEMREALGKLNREFEAAWGTSISTRTGVNTGDVIAGDPERTHSLVVGDTVNVAARLEQSAEPGEILIGEATLRLVRDAVVVEPLGGLSLKGKTEPVPAWRLLEVYPGAPGWTRRLDSPLVGREHELALLQESLELVTASPGCQVVTVMGVAGSGKSRLANEFLSRLGGRARVVKGRCLAYGEGITFWPIVESVRDAAGISTQDSSEEAHRKVMELLPSTDDAPLVGERLAALLGLHPAMPGIQETFWAVRKLFEGLAAGRPLIALFDDIHWGESTFLDLLEYLGDWIRETPVLIICLARPELLEERPGWMTAKTNATLLALNPLTEAESDGLIVNLVGGADLDREARSRIAEVAEGNPLFVEETLRMLVDDGHLRRSNGQWVLARDLSSLSIPVTLHALLGARLEMLESEERAVIERASVVGRVFWWTAVSELSPEELKPNVGRYLQSLMRKELIRPDYTYLGQEDAFRFAHILIRDAAYNGLPKAVRADLHERLVDWIQERSRDRPGEFEEIIGYHLEQAHRTLLELGPMTERVGAVGIRAAVPLKSAGRRAFARGDMPAAVNLLSRAASLLPESHPERLELLPELAFALLETGDLARLQSVVAETSELASASGDAGLQGRAVILGLWMRLFTNPEGWAEEAQREAGRVISDFDKLGDERGLARGWSLLGLVHFAMGHFGEAEGAWEKASIHARRAGDHRDELESLSWVPLSVWAGPTPAEEGIRRCQEILDRAQGDKKAISTALFVQAELEAGQGHLEEARTLIARARALLEEVALTVWSAGPLAQFAGLVELWAGDPVAAEQVLRWGYDQLSGIGEMAWLPTVAGILAECLYEQERYDEADELTRSTEEAAGTEDIYSQVLWRTVRAKVLAQRGQVEEAERLAGESVALAGGTDFLQLHARALMNQAEVLLLSGRSPVAQPAIREAIRLFEAKGHAVGAERARRLLNRVGPAGQ